MDRGEAAISQSATMQNIATPFLNGVLNPKIQVLGSLRQVSLKTQSRARLADLCTMEVGQETECYKEQTHVCTGPRAVGCPAYPPSKADMDRTGSVGEL